jgi:hypothetical protein
MRFSRRRRLPDGRGALVHRGLGRPGGLRPRRDVDRPRERRPQRGASCHDVRKRAPPLVARPVAPLDVDGPMVRFGLPMSLGNAAGFASRKIDNAIVSGLFGADVVGAYHLAYNMADVAAVQVGEQSALSVVREHGWAPAPGGAPAIDRPARAPDVPARGRSGDRIPDGRADAAEAGVARRRPHARDPVGAQRRAPGRLDDLLQSARRGQAAHRRRARGAQAGVSRRAAAHAGTGRASVGLRGSGSRSVFTRWPACSWSGSPTGSGSQSSLAVAGRLSRHASRWSSPCSPPATSRRSARTVDSRRPPRSGDTDRRRGLCRRRPRPGESRDAGHHRAGAHDLAASSVDRPDDFGRGRRRVTTSVRRRRRAPSPRPTSAA